MWGFDWTEEGGNNEHLHFLLADGRFLGFSFLPLVQDRRQGQENKGKLNCLALFGWLFSLRKNSLMEGHNMRREIASRLKKLDESFWPGDNGKIFWVFEDLDGTTTLEGVTYPTAEEALATLPPVRPEDLLIHLTVQDMSKKSYSEEK